VPREARLPSGAAHGKCWGVSSFSRTGYHGPCPPPGKPHHYRFTLYALDAALALAPGATRSEVEAAMKGHILAQATLIGLYGR
jgi:Raf kinase inhibitor-like YbhB/YbcL family protein